MLRFSFPRLNSLRTRLTVLYTALMVLLLSLVCGAAIILLQRSLVWGLDESLADTNRQFVSIVGQLALEDSDAGVMQSQGNLARARYMFANDLIQIERLEFLDRDQLLGGIAASKTPQEQQSFLALVRNIQAHTRLIATGTQLPIMLSDKELMLLIQSPDGRLMIEREIPQAFQEKTVPYRILVTLSQVEWPSFAMDWVMQSQTTPAITYVGRSVAGVQDTISRLQKVFLFLLLTGVLLAGIGAFVLAGQALRPLQQVRQAAERIGGQTLTERVPEPDSGDEVQALAHSLNNMLDRLERSFEAQRRFTSDASHELRTPVTAISGHASYLLRRTNPSEQAKESLNIIKDESERLSNLIASLLDLARSDNGLLTLTKQPVFSRHLLQSVMRELEPVATAQGTLLEVQGPDVLFEADQDRLKQVVINLVSNAMKAGASMITLSSQPVPETADEVQLTVADNGSGIPAEHLHRLFDRFYRVQDSRSRDKGGAGLGLSIAQGIVLAHGGRIWIESEPDQGTRVHVQLPIGDLPVLDDDVP